MAIPIPSSRGKFKTPEEMEAIRKKDAIIQEAAAKNRVPEKNESAPIAYIEVGRYVKGSFRGLFVVSQVVEEMSSKDKHGKALEKPAKRNVKKVIADGVDIVVTMSAIETAIRKKAFR